MLLLLCRMLVGAEARLDRHGLETEVDAVEREIHPHAELGPSIEAGEMDVAPRRAAIEHEPATLRVDRELGALAIEQAGRTEKAVRLAGERAIVGAGLVAQACQHGDGEIVLAGAVGRDLLCPRAG